MNGKRRPSAAFVATILIIVGGCDSRKQRQTVVAAPPSRGIDPRQIAALGPNVTLQEVDRQFGLPFADIPLYEFKADGGGVYIFCFLPTIEIPHPPDASPAGLYLVAVVKSASMEAFRRSQGIYIYPARLRGDAFTGLKLQ